MLDRSEHTRTRARTGALIAAVLCASAPLTAQAVRGLGDDATAPAKGAVRVQISTSIAEYSQRYGKQSPGRADGAREPLGVDFTLDTLGATQFPGLRSAERALQTLTGNSGFTLNIGRTNLVSTVRVQTTPIFVEAGVSRRFSFGVLIPLVSARTEAGLNVNGGVPNGNVGFNAVRLADAQAIAANALVVTQLTTARNQLTAQLLACTQNPGSSAQCPALIAAAPTITTSAAAFADGIASVYGTTANSGAVFVPRTGTAADSAIRNRLAGLRAQFQQFGITALSAATVPQAPAAAVTRDGLRRVISDSTLGLLAAPLNTVTRQGLGDIELSIKMRLFDAFGLRTDSMRFKPTGLNIRQSIAGVVRVGTGRLDQVDDYLDVGTGDGQNDVEFRSFTDIVYGRRFFGSVIARYTVQLADQQLRRITDQPNQVFAPQYREQLVDRKLGNQLELEIAPRFVMSDFISLGAQYIFRQKSEDQFTGTFTVPTSRTGLSQALELDARSLNAETSALEQRFGLGITFSTVAAYQRGQAKFPIELQYVNSRTVAGSGGAVPKLSIHQVQIRWYPRF